MMPGPTWPNRVTKRPPLIDYHYGTSLLDYACFSKYIGNTLRYSIKPRAFLTTSQRHGLTVIDKLLCLPGDCDRGRRGRAGGRRNAGTFTLPPVRAATMLPMKTVTIPPINIAMTPNIASAMTSAICTKMVTAITYTVE